MPKRFLNRIINVVLRQPDVSALSGEKLIKIRGFQFKIRKLNPLDYLSGAQALQSIWTVYQKSPDLPPLLDEGMREKIRSHYIDTLMGGVVWIKLHGIECKPTRKPIEPPEPGKIHISNLMQDWELTESIYASILEWTYGKKKLNPFLSLKTNS